MSWPSALTLSLCLLANRASAVTTRSSLSEEAAHFEQWWSPVAGILKVYQVSDEVFPEPPHRHPPLSLLEEEAQEAQLRGQETVQIQHDADGHIGAVVTGQNFTGQTVNFIVTGANFTGAGVGAWSGKTGTQITFAGATNAAANKVAASVASSNALSIATSQSSVGAKGRVLTATKGKKQIPIAALGWFAWIRLSLSMGFVVKSMCMMCNIFYQASPLPLITEYRFKGDTGEADLAPFIATAYGGWQWCFYGLFAYVVTGKSGFLVLVYSNVVGATLGLYYVYSFNMNCKNKHMIDKRTKYYYVLCTIVTVQFVAIMSFQPVKALFFCGLISSAWSMISSASLIATVPKVLETRCSASLPLPLLVMGTISAVLWILCGVMLWDPWITFPNMFAVTVCVWALYLCYLFPADGGLEEHICDADASLEADCDSVQHGIDVERASPLQRALGLFQERTALTSDAKDTAGTYGAACGTGGTGDSF